MKKTLLLLLAVLLLGTSVSCGDAPAEPVGADAEKTEKNTVGTEAQTAETEIRPMYETGNEPLDFGGADFRMLSNEYPNQFKIFTLIDVEEESGVALEDALFRRNRKLEEQFNFRFAETYVPGYGDMTTAFHKTVRAADDTYDLIMLIARDALSLAATGSMIELTELPYIDLSKPWWVSSINDVLSIGGKLYFAYNDNDLNLFEWTNITLYNKQTAVNYDYDFYEMVQNGTWTMDVMFDTAKEVSADLNNDGKFDENDVIGIVGADDWFYAAFWVSSGIHTVTKDDDDIPHFIGQDAKFISTLDRLYDLVSSPGLYRNCYNIENADLYDASSSYVSNNNVFTNGSAMFSVTNIGCLEILRNMKDDFGVLPMPKYDAAQESYYNRVIDGWPYCVPITNSKPEMTGFLIEELAASAKSSIVPVMYETVLKDKYTRDSQSAEMIDLIYNTRSFDMGDVYWMVAVRNPFVDALNRKKNDFASLIEKRTGGIEKTIDKVVANYNDID